MWTRLMIAAALVAALAVPTTTAAKQDDLRWKSVDRFGRKAVQKYAHLHRKWTKRAGKEVVGRQIAKYGMPRKGRDRLATRREWRRTLAVFDRWEHPPPPPAPPPVMAEQQPDASAAVSGGTGQYSIPAEIVRCESGGDYGAYNKSGATGAYQIMPGTAAGYGCDLSTPAGQDACAARIYAAEGTAPWSASSGCWG
jgi:Transglycosylase-like domain